MSCDLCAQSHDITNCPINLLIQQNRQQLHEQQQTINSLKQENASLKHQLHEQEQTIQNLQQQQQHYLLVIDEQQKKINSLQREKDEVGQNLDLLRNSLTEEVKNLVEFHSKSYFAKKKTTSAGRELKADIIMVNWGTSILERLRKTDRELLPPYSI